MIIGLYLRYIKTYTGINYVPLSNGTSFTGLVGNNGIGKSSVLEALNSLFNNSPWNFNTTVRKSGYETTNPHIVPIFFIPKKSISTNSTTAKELSDFCWIVQDTDILSQNREQFRRFKEQRDILKRDFNTDDYFLIPIGLNHQNKIDLSIFNVRKLGEQVISDFDKANQKISQAQLDEKYKDLLEEVTSYYEYIYIPNDIDPETFTQLENTQIQSLMGETLLEIIEKCVPKQKIQEINKNLSDFLDKLQGVLKDYSFRTSTDRQKMLRKANVYNLIIEDFFTTRKLNKKQGNNWLEVNQLSSGEKQKAIIELAKHLLSNYRSETANIILAIDEPESSLHMSACYDQFNSLYEISSLCSQLMFTTHWYGFIPTIETGNVCVISKKENNHFFDLINIASYREEIKQSTASSKGQLPHDIRLKSLNDFIQSVVTSIMNDEPYNWLICEGSSEKIYFEKYFEDIREETKLRIIPVGGAKEVKRIYQNLLVTYEDFKKNVKGKVILLIDTDRELMNFETHNKSHKNLLCYRMVNNESTFNTELVNVHSNPKSPKTEIEDVLNGKIFFETLLEFKDVYEEIDTILDGLEEVEEKPTYFALDLSPSKQRILEELFDKDNMKFDFAKKYCKKISSSYKEPAWINEIRMLFK